MTFSTSIPTLILIKSSLPRWQARSTCRGGSEALAVLILLRFATPKAFSATVSYPIHSEKRIDPAHRQFVAAYLYVPGSNRITGAGNTGRPRKREQRMGCLCGRRYRFRQ